MDRNILLATAAVAFAANSGGVAPDWVQLLPQSAVTGQPWKGADGRGPFKLTDPKSLLKAICTQVSADGMSGTCDLLFDYDHQADYKGGEGQQKPAAGWITKLEIRPEGVFGQVDWTDRAKTAIAAREYRFVSPVIGYLKSGEIVSIERASLTNTPNFTLKAVASRDLPTTEDSMDIVKLLAALRTALKLGDAATAEECLVAINSRVETAGLADTQKTVLTAIATKLGLKADASQAEFETAINSKIAGASQDETIKSLQSQINALTAANADKTAGEKVTAAMEAGKIAPASKDWALGYAKRDPEGFDTFVAQQPVIIKDAHARAAAPGGDARATTEADAEVMKQLGLTKEQYAKGA